MKQKIHSNEGIAWCNTYLKEHHYQLIKPISTVRANVWSEVYQYPTAQGNLYLKCMAPAFSQEATLLQWLTERQIGPIPTLLVKNDTLDCFIMTDSGTPLRDQLLNSYDEQLASDALRHYAQLQLKTVDHLAELSKIGVNDSRLNKLPKLIEEFLNQGSLLEQDGLSEQEIKQLKGRVAYCAEVCEQLAQFNIPECLEHADFQDNNVLVDQRVLTINDWGDAVLSHPFFSICSFLYSAERQHHITPSNKIHQQLLSNYLNEWRQFESDSRLMEAYELAAQINPVYFAIHYCRILLCAGVDPMKKYRGNIAPALRRLIQP